MSLTTPEGPTLADKLEAVRDLYLAATPDKTDTAWATMTQAIGALRQPPSPADLLRRLDLREESDSARLVVMTQNPADRHYWSKRVGGFTAAEVRAALAKAEA